MFFLITAVTNTVLAIAILVILHAERKDRQCRRASALSAKRCDGATD